MTRRRRKTPRQTPARALLTRLELAAALGCDPRTIAKWLELGLPVARRGRGGRASRYDEAACRAWKTARDEDSHRAGALDPIQERAKRERAQALLAEQMFEVRAKRLLSADDVERVWQAEIAGARALILSSYTGASDRVYRAATTDGLAGVERELRALAHAVLRELARRTSEEPAA